MRGFWRRLICGFFGHKPVETETACWAHAEIGTPLRCCRCGLTGREYYGHGETGITWFKRTHGWRCSGHPEPRLPEARALKR